MVKSPFVFIFVTNWNGKEHLEKLLPSLVVTNYDNYEAVILDNDSSDGSQDFVNSNFPGVEFIRNSRNLGYVGNCNKGFREGLKRRAKYVVLLSNDIILDNRWLKEAVRVLESDTSVGIVGFDILRDPLPSDYDEFVREVKKRKKFSVKEVDNITGCALVIRADMLRVLGPYDPDYVMYGEENDFEARVQRAGYKLVTVSVPLYHAVEGTNWGKVKLKTSFYATRNSMRYAIKNKSFFKALLIIGFVFYFACSPFKRINSADCTQRRLRPRNAFVNFFIVSHSLLWNIWNLYSTLKGRLRDNARADSLREKNFG